jgi:hypothetical protein
MNLKVERSKNKMIDLILEKKKKNKRINRRICEICLE